MANILIQSIQNEDKVKLESVLRHGSQRFIEETISKLPIELYVPFLNLLIDILKEFPKRGSEIIRWICCILTTRASFIASQNFEDNTKNPIMKLKNFLGSRTMLYGEILKLYGRIRLIVRNADRKNEIPQNSILKTAIYEEVDEKKPQFEAELLEEDESIVDHEIACIIVDNTKKIKRSKHNGLNAKIKKIDLP